ncbi:GntP family permease [Rhodococcoides kroppenstedtii]|uniref:GntP family permease n=1 Tax=Rhodococcoides kroppenstedtii TaxID=293050 RepID=UPI0036280E4B
MDIMEPAYGTAYLLTVAAVAVAVLLVLIMKVRLHPFLALVLVSMVTAVAAGIPLADVPDTLLAGFGGTLGSVALLVALGVMLGRLLEKTGGAQVLANTLIARFGEKRAPLALGIAALIFGFPIFFDAGLVIFLPIIFSVARQFGGSVLLYALPTAGAFAAMHAIVPPHPGPVAAADLMGGDIGVTLIVGVPVAVVAWFVGAYLVGTRLGRRIVTSPAAMFGDASDGDDRIAADPPKFVAVLGLLLFPLILICLNTGISTLQTAGTVPEDAAWADALVLLGQTPVALLLTVLLSLVVLAPGRFSIQRATALMDDALGPICAIILITGAGGMFGGVLRASGIGTSLTESLSGLGFSLIVQAFLIATALRVAQGSATVALTTTAGLVSAQVAAQELDDFHVALLVFAIAAGSTVLSHVNDSGFWLVGRFFGMDVKTTLKTWTVLETTLGLAVFLLAALLWVVF